ncbi:hypothetical protein Tcan_03452 [Toxocara canis]|uniref:Uncharacterized protein n=1 Tax=Toxocara canis TaxID=6265 RepID=A0A0B2VJL3_TOXCA|nr:hypothetical protein Tcan_03452 [Toxocara canis]
MAATAWDRSVDWNESTDELIYAIMNRDQRCLVATATAFKSAAFASFDVLRIGDAKQSDFEANDDGH